MRAARRRSSFRGETVDQARGWFRSVLLRTASELNRIYRRQNPLRFRAKLADEESLVDPLAIEAGSEIEAAEVLDEVEAVLARLPESQVQVFVQAVLLGRTTESLADELGCTTHRVSQVLWRARRRVQALLSAVSAGIARRGSARR